MLSAENNAEKQLSNLQGKWVHYYYAFIFEDVFLRQ